MNDRDLVACALAPSDLRGRRERWLRLSHHALLEKEPIQAGVLLRFQRLEGVEAELRELAALERDCCSFATWSVTGEATELHLQVAAEGEGSRRCERCSTSLGPSADEAIRSLVG